VSSMVSSENLVFDNLAKPSRYNHALRGTYCTHTHTHTDTHTHTRSCTHTHTYILAYKNQLR